jgi:peptidase C25-like protein/all-beta uncharacterized protein/Ig-like domain-containing protein
MSTIAALAVGVPAAFVQQQGGSFALHPSVIPGGGGTSTNGSISLSGSIGQAVLGSSSGGAFTLDGGFWQSAFPCAAAAVTSEPSNQSVCAGSPANFSVTAAGTGLSYRWRKNGTNLSDGDNISGSTTSTLKINPTTANDAASYDVLISSACGAATSTAAALTVNSFSLSSMSQSFGASGGPGSVDVMVPGSCPWTVVSNATWISIGASNGGVGNGTVSYTVAENTGPARSGTITIAGLTYTVNQSSPTEVRLVSFTAERGDDGVYLEWETGFEVDNLGFNLYRQIDGVRQLITPQLIAGSALMAGFTPLTAGKSYSWLDNASGSGSAAYWLEDLDINGSSTWHGPVYTSSISGKGRANRVQRATLLSALGADGRRRPASKPLAATASMQMPTADNLRLQRNIAATNAVKLSVTHEAFYRVTKDQLISAGLSAGVNPRYLQLIVDGAEQPVSVVAKSTDSADFEAIEFYGLGSDSPYSDARTYWVVAGDQPGRRIQVVGAKPGSKGADSFPFTVELKDRSVYFASLLNGDAENWFGGIITSQGLERTLTVDSLDGESRTGAEIEIALQGVTSQPANPDHQVQVLVNGQLAGNLSFDGREHKVQRFKLDSGVIRAANNVITLAATGASDVSLLDAIRITYPHKYSADGDSLKLLTQSDPTSQRIDNFTSQDIRAFDVTDPANVRELVGVIEPQTIKRFSITVDAQLPGRTVLALTSAQFKTPAGITGNVPSSLASTENRADFIILTRREFADALKPLKVMREKEGLATLLVDVEDVYDEFSFGQKTPYALRAFLSYARANWALKPGFVLLAGDASLDPRDHTGLGETDLVPTKLLDTSFMETASDDWLIDLNDDSQSGLAVGRLPIRTVQEASAMVAKILAYGAAEPSPDVVLFADLNDVFDFETASLRLRDLMPASLRVQEIFRSRNDNATTKSILIEAINRGSSIVNYTGHGSLSNWRDNMLTTSDARALTNQKLAVFVIMNCLNGYFQDPANESLAEGLMRNEKAGAVAVWASSGMTFPSEQATMNQQLYRVMYGRTGLRLGEQVGLAKLAASDIDVRRSWILFGDPTMRIR